MRTNPQTLSRTRPHARLLLVVIAMLAGSFASLALATATAETADACSISGPSAQVMPSTDLHPGQRIEIAGWGFQNLVVHEPVPHEENADVPPELCDFDLVPMSNVQVYWQGTTSSWLATVEGPDFAVSVTVPLDAIGGSAWITVGTVEVPVSVSTGVAPPSPPPCPLAVAHDDSVSSSCPEPWPCHLYDASQTQRAPAPDYAPGFQPPCPEPCVDYAHTVDDGTVYDYQWECPDPCSQTQVSPGAGDEALAVWCPPPEPCVAYLDAGVGVDGSLVGCPDPCGQTLGSPGAGEVGAGEVGGGAAVWCPPPCPSEGDAVAPCGPYTTQTLPTQAPAAEVSSVVETESVPVPDQIASVTAMQREAADVAMQLIEELTARLFQRVGGFRIVLFW